MEIKTSFALGPSSSEREFFFLKRLGRERASRLCLASLEGMCQAGVWCDCQGRSLSGSRSNKASGGRRFDYGTNIHTMQLNLSATRTIFQARNKLYLHAFILTGKGGRVNCEFGGKWSAKKVEMCRHGLPSATWVKVTQRIHHFFYPCNFGKWHPHPQCEDHAASSSNRVFFLLIPVFIFEKLA